MRVIVEAESVMPAVRKSEPKPHSVTGAYKRKPMAVTTNPPRGGAMPMFGRLAGRIVIAEDFDAWPDEVLDAIEGVRP